jgi:fumarate reductase subunit C
MTELRLYIVQRATAALMVPFILVHIAVIFYAISDGLTADEILARTGGSIGWGLFYTVFVLLASSHGAIGVRSVLKEWTPLDNAAADILSIGFGVLLVLLGLRAVYAVVFT